MNGNTVFHGAPVVRNLVRPELRPLLTVRAVAELLDVSTATVYALVKRGDLPHVRVSNSIRITAAQLESYLAR